MKRYVICAYSMVLWFLIFSTIFSVRVEQLMIPIVTECSPYTSQTSTEAVLDLDCLFQDEEGLPVLYQTYEGLDWDAGLRVKAVSPTVYTVLEDHISCGGLENAIQYSTKELRMGEKIAAANPKETRDDIYLAACPTGVRLREDLPESLAVIAQTETALLAEESQAPAIFMPKRAAGGLFQEQPYTLPDERVYSLVDINDFFEQLPIAALLPGILLFVLLLWIFSFPLLKDMKKNRWCLLLRGVLSALTLPAAWLLLRFLNLPSSLLPQNNIVSAAHYIQAFSEIFSNLRFFADASIFAAHASLSHAYRMIFLALGVILLCVISAIFVLFFRRPPRHIKQ